MKWLIFTFFCLHGHDQALHPVITILGTGYVGLVTGTCLADFGHTVFCVDTDTTKIGALNNNIIPIYEPGLKEIVVKNVEQKRLFFTTDIDYALAVADCIFIAVGTPMAADGCADLAALHHAFSMIIPHLDRYKLICIKSTVPIGTGEKFLRLLENSDIDKKLYDIVSNPEFLREGSAIWDFMNPDRIIIGTQSVNARNLMQKIYEPLLNKKVPCLYTSLIAAETIKYASNAFLATKLSFVNEIACLCDKTGADVLDVVQGMGLDPRIGNSFLKPGPGFGGSCFPKDCYALIKMGDICGVCFNVVAAALQTNEEQKKKPVQKLCKLLNNNVQDKKIAVLGLAFKNNTDDVRYSPAITTIELLLEKGATINAYDPVANVSMQKLFPQIAYASSIDQAVSNADGIIIMTEWDEFKNMDLERVGLLLKNRVLVDTRNLLDPSELKQHGFVYSLMGRH